MYGRSTQPHKRFMFSSRTFIIVTIVCGVGRWLCVSPRLISLRWWCVRGWPQGSVYRRLSHTVSVSLARLYLAIPRRTHPPIKSLQAHIYMPPSPDHRSGLSLFLCRVSLLLARLLDLIFFIIIGTGMLYLPVLGFPSSSSSFRPG